MEADKRSRFYRHRHRKDRGVCAGTTTFTCTRASGGEISGSIGRIGIIQADRECWHNMAAAVPFTFSICSSHPHFLFAHWHFQTKC